MEKGGKSLPNISLETENPLVEEIIEYSKKLTELREETMGIINSLNRIHSKIRKHSDKIWNSKVAKKCKRLYNEAIKRMNEENTIISQIIPKIDSYLGIPTLSEEPKLKREGGEAKINSGKKKKRKTEETKERI
jgi:hypothetical protein